MTMSVPEDPIAALGEDESTKIVRVEAGAVGAIVKSEVEAQLDAAHRYPRSVSRFLKEACSLATVSQEVAESCIYSLPRGGKMITGPSVRLAEICASAYGNLHAGMRVVDVEDANVVGQGVAWDLEKNLRVTLEVRRRITNKHGKRYDDDMITMTGNAACSIAFRNAVFRVIPRAFVTAIYDKIRAVAVGDAKTLDARRLQVIERFEKLGVSRERVLLRLEKKGIEDLGLEDLENLIGIGTAIKNGDATIEQAFPVAAPAPTPQAEEGRRVSMRGNANKPKDEPPREPGADG